MVDAQVALILLFAGALIIVGCVFPAIREYLRRKGCLKNPYESDSNGVSATNPTYGNLSFSGARTQAPGQVTTVRAQFDPRTSAQILANPNRDSSFFANLNNESELNAEGLDELPEGEESGGPRVALTSARYAQVVDSSRDLNVRRSNVPVAEAPRNSALPFADSV